LQPVDNDLIERRAYEIWESEGRPHGRDRDHWDAAAAELRKTSTKGKTAAEVAAPAAAVKTKASTAEAPAVAKTAKQAGKAAKADSAEKPKVKAVKTKAKA
jgi:hypothetical protein